MKRPSSLHPEWKEAGHWLKRLREDAGLTQMELANRLDVKYYSFISQVENGFSRVPTVKLEPWAQILGVNPAYFARCLISFYEPDLHRVLYGTKSPQL